MTTSSSAYPIRRDRPGTTAPTSSDRGRQASTTSCSLPATRSASTASPSPAASRRRLTIRLLVAVRCGELWPPQLARQLASLDRMLGGRLTINIISSDLPGESLASEPRYRRTLEVMQILRTLLDGQPVDHHGEFYDLTLDPPSARPCRVDARRSTSADCPNPPATSRQGRRRLPHVARHDGRSRGIDRRSARPAARHGRSLRFGYRVHVIVRDTETEARAAAARLVSRLDDDVGRRDPRASLDSHPPASGARPNSATMPATTDTSKTTSGRASDAPAAGAVPPSSAIPIRCSPSSRRTERSGSTHSSSRAIRTGRGGTLRSAWSSTGAARIGLRS